VAFLWNGVLGRLEGVLLVLGYVAGVVWVWRREKQPPMIGELAELDDDDDAGPDSGRPLLLVLAGVVGMVAGGYLAVRGAEGLVGVLGLSESAVGLTILALATSAEMVALVWAAHRRGVTEVVLAGAVGAVAYNATVSIGLGAVVSPLALGRGTPVITIGAVTAVLPLVLLLGLRRGRFPRALGVLLVCAYVVSAGWLLTR
jgi:cation:H+ antiporter